MKADSISLVEDFFGAELGGGFSAEDITSVPPKQVEELLQTIFENGGTPFKGALRDPTPDPPEPVADGWAIAFHTPSALFAPERIFEETRRLLPMVLYLDRLALIDPLGAVAHYGEDFSWDGIKVVRMFLKRPPPSRRAYERLRREKVRRALLLLEELKQVHEQICLVPAANWGLQAAGSAWDWEIQMWAYNRMSDVDAGYEPRDEPRPDPDLALVEYLRAASVASIIPGDKRSWSRAADDVARHGEDVKLRSLSEVLLACPAEVSGADLQLVLQDDDALALVRSNLSAALEAAASIPSDDATQQVVEAFRQSGERLRRREQRRQPGGVELTAGGLAIGGVVLDLTLTGKVDPSAVLGAVSAQLPLLHGAYRSKRESEDAEVVRGTLLRLGRPLEVSQGVAELKSDPMTKTTTQAFAGRILTDQVAMCKRVGVWPPRAVYGFQLCVDVLLDWVWDELGTGEDAIKVICDQNLFDRAVALFDSLCPIEPHGTWALLVLDCFQQIVKTENSLIEVDPLTFHLRRPSWR